jgi:hypothetical protein
VAGAGELFQELRMRLNEPSERGSFAWYSVHKDEGSEQLVLHDIVCYVHYQGFEMGTNIMSIQNNGDGSNWRVWKGRGLAQCILL